MSNIEISEETIKNIQDIEELRGQCLEFFNEFLEQSERRKKADQEVHHLTNQLKRAKKELRFIMHKTRELYGQFGGIEYA